MPPTFGNIRSLWHGRHAIQSSRTTQLPSPDGQESASLRNACDASQACRTWEGNLKHNLTTLGDEPSQLDVVSRVRLTPEDRSCTIGGILPCFLGGCATNCPGEGTETPTCLSLYVKEDWVEGGKPTETRKSYFTHKLPIGVTTKAAECPWSEPSMVPGLTGCAGAGLGFASERPSVKWGSAGCRCKSRRLIASVVQR